jgi:imidazolonepropionase-like amidohydrolase
MSDAVIEYATAIGTSTLGHLAPLSGQLQAGYEADVICLDVNPLDDLSVFADVAHVVGGWRGGWRGKG